MFQCIQRNDTNQALIGKTLSDNEQLWLEHTFTAASIASKLHIGLEAPNLCCYKIYLSILGYLLDDKFSSHCCFHFSIPPKKSLQTGSYQRHCPQKHNSYAHEPPWGVLARVTILRGILIFQREFLVFIALSKNLPSIATNCGIR